jgi:hypothetical protein
MSHHVLLELEDGGEDFTWFRVDIDTGLIVACGPFQAFVWVGRHVRPDTSDWQAGSSIIFTADDQVLNYRVTAVSRHEADIDATILRQLSQHDSPMAVTGQADAAEVKRLARQDLVHWSEAARSPGSRVRGHASITAAGLDFLNRMTGSAA